MGILSKSPLPFNGKIRRNDGNEQGRDKENRNKKNVNLYMNLEQKKTI